MILALETTGPKTQLWLLPPGAIDVDAAVGHDEWESGRSLADGLLERIDQFCQRAGIGWFDLTGLVIKRGPGSFTSLRIGHSVANALAAGLQLPIASAGGTDWLKVALLALPDRSVGEPVWPDYGADRLPHQR